MSIKSTELHKIDLDRVKRNAKSLREVGNISLCKAQNKLAQRYGYQTFASLRTAVMAARSTASPTLPVSADPDLDALLDWFRSRYTRIDQYESRVSLVIAKSLRQYEHRHGTSALHTVDVGDEIDFQYQYRPFQITRHPKALEAQDLLEAEGEWVENAFLDGLRVRKGGFWGDGPDTIVGDRITILAFDEDFETALSR